MFCTHAYCRLHSQHPADHQCERDRRGECSIVLPPRCSIQTSVPPQFNTIWQEHARSGRPYTLISDDLSQSLIKLQNDLEESNLYDDVKLRRSVISRAVPRTLLDQVGLDKLMERMPESYALSVFASYVSSVSSLFLLDLARTSLTSPCSDMSTRMDSRRRRSTSTDSSNRFTEGHPMGRRRIEGTRSEYK